MHLRVLSHPGVPGFDGAGMADRRTSNLATAGCIITFLFDLNEILTMQKNRKKSV